MVQQLRMLEATETECREAEQLYRILTDNSPVGIYIICDRKFVYVNAQFQRYTDYTEDELLGAEAALLVHPGDREMVRENAVAMIKGNRLSPYEFRVIGKNGNVIWTMETVTAIHYKGQKAALGNIMDITERKWIEEKLQQRERELAIRNKIADIFLTTPDEEIYGAVLPVILEATESKHGVFGYISEDGAWVCPSLNMGMWEQCLFSSEDRVFPSGTWGGIWGRALRKKKALYSNEGFRVPLGHISISRALDVPIIHKGEVIGNFLVANKATDYDEQDRKMLEAIASYVAPPLEARLQGDKQERARRKVEEKRQKLYQREKRLRRRLESEIKKRVEFTRALVHELKTPLTPVMASSDVLVDGLKEEPWLSLAKNVSRGASNLDKRINELLDLARGEVGMLKLMPKRVSLLELIREVVEDMTPVASSYSQSLILDLPPSLPMVWADEVRLRQIVLNLLSNACKFTPDGGDIIVKAKEEDANLIVEVHDTGPGMTREEQRRLFQPYHRIEVDRERLSGLGLGLALCKTLVELHEGQIWVQSKKGEGSFFSFSVPLNGVSQREEGLKQEGSHESENIDY